MNDLLQLIEEPRRCSYLADEKASLEFRLVDGVTPDGYSRMLERGYRRFGSSLFRPACPACSRCISLRVLLQEFRPSRTQRRVLKRNREVRAECHELSVSRRHLQLYESYHRFMADLRGWPMQNASFGDYVETFLLGGEQVGLQWLYYRGSRLIGVALMDEVGDAISLVYFYHDPDWRPDGPGIFSVLTQLDYARRKGLAHAYLGYWIAGNPSMSYKNQFRPHELLSRYPVEDESPDWRRAD